MAGTLTPFIAGPLCLSRYVPTLMARQFVPQHGSEKYLTINLLSGLTMKTHLLLIKCLIGLILLSMYACEKDKPANNFDLLTNGSSKVWYLKRIVPNSVGSELPVCLTDDEHKFLSDGKYIVDNMGTFLTDDMGQLNCSDAPNLTFTYSWSFNLTMDTITIIYPSSLSLYEVQKLTGDSLIIKNVDNELGIQTKFYVSKK